MSNTISNRPYLIRAIYEWIVDINLTPYIIVDANFSGVQVPQDYVDDGKIILNISPDACRGLHLENDRIIFTAKFAGDPMQVFIPPCAILALYAKENGKGMFFNNSEITEEAQSLEDEQEPETGAALSDADMRANVKSRLTLVKNN